MNIGIIEIIASALIKYGPAAAKALYEIFTKPAPTDADWNKVFDLAEKSYEDYVKPVEPAPPAPV